MVATSFIQKVKKLYVAQNGIMSTPAVSCVIRKNGATGGFILSASHNPGGPKGDFGIKFNTENGGPAPTDFTEKIFHFTETLAEYNIVNELDCDVTKVGVQQFKINDRDFEVEVVDSLNDYVDLMKSIFDFDVIRNYLKSTKILINSLHGGKMKRKQSGTLQKNARF